MKLLSTQAGLSYIEVLIASVLIAITLVPAMDAITPTLTRNDTLEQRAVRQHSLTSKLEDVLGESFSTLDTEALTTGDPTNSSDLYSDAAGTQDRRLVYLSRYDGDDVDGDGDGFTGTDQGLLWIRVEIADSDQELFSIVSRTGID